MEHDYEALKKELKLVRKLFAALEKAHTDLARKVYGESSPELKQHIDEMKRRQLEAFQ